MKITFLGAARDVTGSNFLVETNHSKFIIDCGMFQGGKELERLNEEAFRFVPSELDFAILTHAHIDHSGRLPKLVKDGFRGRIYATKPTVDLCDVMLKDSAKIQESDAQWENKRRQRSGKELIEPLYTMKDAEDALKHFVPNHYGSLIQINEEVTIRFVDAGHILGSAILEMWVHEEGKTTKVVFSGDLGMPGRPIIRDPQIVDGADYLLLESTYGNTVHESIDASIQRLIEIIDEVTTRGGSVIIPSFAVGRTQELIYELNKYYEHNQRIEEYQRIPIYIDSPMAILATQAFMKNSYVFDEEARDLIRQGDNIFEFRNLKYVQSAEESKMLNTVRFPRVIISSSGMATAGRVRHHLKHHLWDEKSAVVFVGYQAVGSLGRILEDGAKSVKLLGETIAVNCDIHRLDGFSGHADEPMLLNWVDSMKTKPSKVFLVHGEPEESEPLAMVLREKLDLEVKIPELWETVELGHLNRSESPVNKEEILSAVHQEMVDLDLNMDSFDKVKQGVEWDQFPEEKAIAVKQALKDLNRNLMDLNLLVGK